MLWVTFRRTGSWFPRVMLGALLLTVATQALRPMVSYRALALGGGALDIGIIASSFALLSLVVAVPLGRRVDRWGEPIVLLGGSVVVLSTAVSLLWIDSVWLLAVNQAALGLGQIMFVVANQALVASGGDAETRDGRYGIFTAVISLGQLIGPAVAGVLAGGGTTGGPTGEVDTGSVFALTSALAAGAVVVSASLVMRPPAGHSARRKEAAQATRTGSMAAMRQIARIPSMPQAMVVSLTVLTSIDVLATYLPVYGEQRGLSVQAVGYLLAVRAGASIAARLLMLQLVRLLGRRRLLILSLVGPAVGLLVFPFVGLPGQVVAMVVVGLGLGLGQPVTLSWVAATAPRTLLGTALGLRLTGNRLGQAALPAVIGALAAATGVTAVFLTLAAMLLGGSSLLLRTRFDDEQPASAAAP